MNIRKSNLIPHIHTFMFYTFYVGSCRIFRVTDPCFAITFVVLTFSCVCVCNIWKRDEEYNNMYVPRPMAYNFPFDSEFFLHSIRNNLNALKTICFDKIKTRANKKFFIKKSLNCASGNSSNFFILHSFFSSFKPSNFFYSRSSWSLEKNHENKMVAASISILKNSRERTREEEKFFVCFKIDFPSAFHFILLISTIANWKILSEYRSAAAATVALF